VSRRWKRVRSRWDDSLTRVGWADFEYRVAAYYRSQGYRVEHTGTGSTFGMSDGGIDLKLFRGDEYTVVQCKHWNVGQVPHNAVHELIGVMHTEHAQRAILISSGEFTRHAMRSAEKYPPIQLIGGAEIRAMLGPIPEMDRRSPETGYEPLPSWMRHQRPRRPRGRRAPDSVAAIVTRGIAMAAIVLIACLVIPHVFSTLSAGIMKSTTQNLANLRAAAPTLPTQPVAAYRHDIPSVAMMPANHGHRDDVVGTGMPSPITTTDGRPRALGTTPTTKAEMAAWEADNAKAMKILEKTTPELGSN
jgi:hypothetical protein